MSDLIECPSCRRQVRLRQLPTGEWMTFEGTARHSCPCVQESMQMELEKNPVAAWLAMMNSENAAEREEQRRRERAEREKANKGQERDKGHDFEM